MDKLLGLLGLAKRAGKIAQGTPSCQDAVRKKTAMLVILAGDASENTKKAISNSCKFYNTNYIICKDKSVLGKALGTDVCSAVAVLDNGFADAIFKLYKESEV